MNNDTMSIRHMSCAAYNYAIKNDIYYKIVEGEIDVTPTFKYFNIKDCQTPCEVVRRKFEKINRKGDKANTREFIHHLAVYYAFLDIYMGIVEMATVKYETNGEETVCL